MLDPALFIKVVRYKGCCSTLESYLDGNEVFEFITLGDGRTIPSDELIELSQFVIDCDGPVKNEDGRGLMGIGIDCIFVMIGLILPFGLILTGNLMFFNCLRCIVCTGNPLVSCSSTYASSSSSELDSSLRRLRLLLRGQHGDSSKFIFLSISAALNFLSFFSILKYIKDILILTMKNDIT